MTLREYMKLLEAKIKEEPKSLDMEVIYAGDDEGNYYNPVHYTPSIGNFNGYEFNTKSKVPNCVCLN